MAENNCIYPLANQHAGQPCLVLLYCYRHPRQAPESVASANPFWWRGPMFGRALANQNATRSSGFWLTSRTMAWDRANPVWPSKRLCLFCLFPRPISTVHLRHQSPLASLHSLHTSRTDPLVPSLSFLVSLSQLFRSRPCSSEESTSVNFRSVSGSPSGHSDRRPACRLRHPTAALTPTSPNQRE